MGFATFRAYMADFAPLGNACYWKKVERMAKQLSKDSFVKEQSWSRDGRDINGTKDRGLGGAGGKPTQAELRRIPTKIMPQ